MPHLDFTLSCPVFDSFRVRQVAGMFDVPIEEKTTQRFSIEAPDLESPWQIGLIVGPSGSGKSTIARRLFGKRLYEAGRWPEDRAVIDGFGDRPIKEITGVLTAVGFSSPPSWIKPYHVLSNGERFRCDLARALLGADGGGWTVNGERATVEGQPRSPFTVDRPPIIPTVVFDEFTSVVDRNVARIASAAIGKAIRGGMIGCRFVAVTCHYDVTEWLAPDWVLDMASGGFTRRRLPRPPIELAVVRCTGGAWRLFARHHYLSGSLSPAARCYLALWRHEPVAFCATLPAIGRRGRWRISRIVTLPDYQGVGIGMAMMETVAQLHRDEGLRINITASHPAVIAHCRRSPRWRAVRVKKCGSCRADHLVPGYRHAAGRAVVSFEYRGNRV